MKFLVDNQLPTAVARWITSLGHDAIHVLDIGLAKTDNHTLWNISKEQQRIMVSKDEDFLFLATRPTDQGRLLWLRLGNCRKQTLLLALENNWQQIEAAFNDHQRIVEVR